MIEKPSVRTSLSFILLLLLPISLSLFGVYQKEGFVRPDWVVGGLLITNFWGGILYKARLKANAAARWVLILNLAAIVSALNLIDSSSVQEGEFLTAWLQLLFASGLFFAISNARISRGNLVIFLKVWILYAFLVAIYGIYQAFARNLGWPLAYIPMLNPTAPTIPQLQWGLGFGGYVRPSSVLREPSYLGLYLLPPLLITGILTLLNQDRDLLFRRRWFNRFVFAVIAVAFILSFSLSAYLTLAGTLFVALWDRRLRSRFIARGIVAVWLILSALVLIQLSIPFREGIAARLERIVTPILQGTPERGEMDASVLTRLTEASVALRVWLVSPFIGVGLNGMEFATLEHNIDAPVWFYTAGLAERGYVHNMWLQALAEMGLLGFVALLGVYATLMRHLMKAFPPAGPPVKAMLLVCFYIMVADMIRGVMGGTYFHTTHWFNLGFASLILQSEARWRGGPG